MSSKNQIDNFLEILEVEAEQNNILEFNGKSIALTPLTFKQQKALVTSGLDGLIGIISFIQRLNDVIIENTGLTNLRLSDRMPLVVHLRNLLSDKPIDVDGVKVEVSRLLENIVNFDGSQTLDIEEDKFTIRLSIPTLSKENKFLVACSDELKPLLEGGLGENISAILSYEIPKFIDSIEFGETIIKFDSISIKDQLKIVNKLPATITAKISEFIGSIREYDEKILTVDDVTVDLDSSFFE